MLMRSCHVACRLFPAALLFTVCAAAVAQMQVQHTPYNDLVTKMNMDGETLFATAETRKHGAGSFLARRCVTFTCRERWR